MSELHYFGNNSTALLGCENSGREQLVAALPAQLDAQGWDLLPCSPAAPVRHKPQCLYHGAR
ncbi:hypothetical protein HaLaN_11969 [Haematococcus lacustris]|uniref:Uncharacterized protein n=1 Tax=Haematococcus lacustris TaxID=44745 RepID=A0A699Z2C2_HAELA|nr:hypothetical protein HaLaN_11969 [Haematococcus lacustris]